MSVPLNRIRAVGQGEVNPAGRYVLYVMAVHRRLGWNFALQHAVDWAVRLGRPLLVFEPLSADEPWASDRLHRFAIDGMADAAAAAAGRRGMRYLPYVEPSRGAGADLLARLASKAAVAVIDDFPAFAPARAVDAAARPGVRLEAVDGNGLLPMRLAGRAFVSAYAFRRYLQQTLPQHLGSRPEVDPLARLPDLPAPDPARIVAGRWRSATRQILDGTTPLASLPIDHAVPPVAARGGSVAAGLALERFVAGGLRSYGALRGDVEAEAGSRLSAYLHYGHIGSWQVVARVLDSEGWLGVTAARPTGARQGWWGVSPAAEAFLDQIVTWRELGFNMCAAHPDTCDQYESLPAWAQATLGKHAADRRAYAYRTATLESGATHDALWNAAQGQLREEGRIHNYLRMLWGKKILEWTASPREALAVMIELNNRFAVDGRDPNSYSGIFWTLGRYDRPWAPERPVFGTVRYMSSENTARKMRVQRYIRRYAPGNDAPAQPAP